MKHAVRLSTGTVSDVGRAVELAVAAEESGWDGVFVSDSILFDFADPWTVLSAIAASTGRVSLGTWVSPVPQQQPWRLAHSVAALDQISGGRVIVGAGLGTRQEYEMFGIPYDRRTLAQRYDEALDIITRLWAGGPVTFSGEHFTVSEASLPITPAQTPRVPVLTAAWWPNRAAFRRALAWDGIMPYWPALLRGEPGPEGQVSDAAIEDELRALVDYYRSIGGEGEIAVPREERDREGYVSLCEDLGVTWLLTTFAMDASEIAQGPPR